MEVKTIERIRQLEAKDGTLDPRNVLDDARDPESPLHSHFEWDDSKAAEAHRMEQARTLIRSVRLVITNTESIYRTVAYVRDPDKAAHDPGYVSTMRLRSQPERAQSALIAELERADNALARAYDVAHSLGLADQVQGLRDKLATVKEAA